MKAYIITIPNLQEYNSKFQKDMHSKLIRRDFFKNKKVALLDDKQKNLYLFLILEMDNEELVITDKFIKKELEYPRKRDLETDLNALSVLKLVAWCPSEGQMDVKKTTARPQIGTKTPQHIKDTHVEQKNKVNKKINKGQSKFDQSIFFEEIWKQYPNKLGKAKAFKSFQATVTCEDDLQKIRQAFSRYHKHLAANPWKKPQHGSTWFNQWQEWVDYNEPTITTTETQKDRCPACNDYGRITYCGTDYACYCLIGVQKSQQYQWEITPDDIKYEIQSKLQEAA